LLFVGKSTNGLLQVEQQVLFSLSIPVTSQFIFSNRLLHSVEKMNTLNSCLKGTVHPEMEISSYTHLLYVVFFHET